MEEVSRFLSKYSSLIVWIPTLIFLVIFFLEIIRGIMRGLRKNLIFTIMSLVSLGIAFIIFFCVLRKNFFQAWILDLIKDFSGKSVSSMLKLSKEYNTFNGICNEYVYNLFNGKTASNIYPIFSPYILAIANSILGLIYMLITGLVWKLIYIILYLFIYLPIFREGKYKKKKKKATYDYYDFIEYKRSGADVNDYVPSKVKNYNKVKKANIVLSDEEAKEAPKEYKRRRLFGGLVGVFRGIFSGILAISTIGTLFFIVRGSEVYSCKNNEVVVLTFNNKEYQLSEIYDFFYEYETTGLNVIFENIKTPSDTPLYAAIPNIFCNSKITILEDGVVTRVYPIDELAAISGIVHDGVRLLSKYNIDLSNSSSINKLNTLTNDETFVNDLYGFVESFGRTNLQRALGKTINAHFVDLIDTLGKSNKYVEMIFKGENAITLADLTSKEDVKSFINIGVQAINIYEDYKDSKDYKKVLLSSLEEIKILKNELFKLSIFNSNKYENINNILSDLIQEGIGKVKALQGIELEGISWVNDKENDGEIERFINAIIKFLDTDILIYNEGTFNYDFSKINSICTKDENNISLIDDIKSSKALRLVASKYLIDTKIGGKKLYIPSSCLENEKLIKEEEFESLFDGLSNIISKLEIKYDTPITLSKFKDDVLPELLDSLCDNETLSDDLTKSKVLSSIASKYLYDLLEKQEYDKYIATSLALDDEHIENNISKWTDKELNLFIASALELYKEEVISYDSGLEFDFNKIDLITSNSESDFMTKGSESLILRGLLPGIINDTISDSFEIYFPSDSYLLDGDIKILTQKEFKAFFNTIGVITSKIDLLADDINVEDISNKILDIISDDLTKKRLFGSYIMESSLSIVLYNKLNETGMIDSLIDNLLLDDANKDDNIINWYGESKEFKKLIDSIDTGIDTNLLAIDFNSSETISYDLNNISNLFSNNEVDTLLYSDVIHCIFTDIIDKFDIGYEIYTPEEVYDDNSLIKKEELKSTLKALSSFTNEGIDFYSESISEDIKDKLHNISKNSVSKNNILESIIMSGTLSNAIYQVLDENESLEFKFPSTLDLSIDDNMDNWIKEEGELSLLFDSLAIVDISNVDSTDFIFEMTDDDIYTIINSNIVRFTISDQYINCNLTVPNKAYEDIDASEKYITREEIVNTINGLKVLDITSIDNISIDNSDVLDIGNESDKINTLINSYIIWLEVSTLICDYIINIPNEAKYIDLTDSDLYLTKDEITSLINALYLLEIDNLESYSITSDLLFNDNIDECLDSFIIWLEFSKKMLESTLIILDEVYDNTYSDYIKKDEIIDVIDILSSMSLDNLDDIRFSPNDIVNSGLTRNISSNLILRSTITNILFVDNDIKIIKDDNYIVDTYNLENNTYYVFTDDEVYNTIIALDHLGINDFNKGINFNLSTFISLGYDICSDVLKSSIIWVYISKDLIIENNLYVSDDLDDTYIIIDHNNLDGLIDNSIIKKESILGLLE